MEKKNERLTTVELLEKVKAVAEVLEGLDRETIHAILSASAQAALPGYMVKLRLKGIDAII